MQATTAIGNKKIIKNVRMKCLYIYPEYFSRFKEQKNNTLLKCIYRFLPIRKIIYQLFGPQHHILAGKNGQRVEFAKEIIKCI